MKPAIPVLFGLCGHILLSAPALSSCEIRDLIFPLTSTIAGDGRPGVSDGPALAGAEFIEPSGIAVAHDGSIYVADAGAQTVRVIKSGRVTTIAGASGPSVSKEQRTGGYLDGPADRSKFNRPVGLALLKDGSLIIADSLNGAIRKLAHGQVTTLVKGLDDPRAVAVDADNHIIVADHGSGIREILADGTLSALDSISPQSARTACGVAVKGSGKDRIIVYTDDDGIHEIEDDVKRSLLRTDAVEPLEPNDEVGSACSVAIYDRDSIVASDLYRNSVKLVRFPIGGFAGAPPVVRTLITGYSEAALTVGEFRDGPSPLARANVPRSIALTTNGSIVFADSGNRRVREILGVNPRHTVSTDKNNAELIPSLNRRNYRIALFGNSFLFSNALWADSIPGNIERTIAEHGREAGLTKCPELAAYRASSASTIDLADLASTYYADGEADLVIFLVDEQNLEKDILAIEKSKGIPETPELNTRENENLGQRIAVPERLRKLNEELDKSHTAMLLVFVPDGRGITPLENVRDDGLPLQYQEFFTDARPNFSTYKMAQATAALYRSSGVPFYDLTNALAEVEDGAIRSALFNTADSHPTPKGNLTIGSLIGNELLRLGPWKRGH